jgi:electron transfer flavoprotein beta subunit
VHCSFLNIICKFAKQNPVFAGITLYVTRFAMKILVCISHVPDTTAKITFTPDNKEFVSAGVTFIINPYDEIAVARALELAEASGGTVTVIHVGDASTEPTLRKALAIGAHNAVRINAAPAMPFMWPARLRIMLRASNMT